MGAAGLVFSGAHPALSAQLLVPFQLALDANFQEFCLQVLFECISKDRPALLQVYLSLYTIVGSMADQVTRGDVIVADSLSVSNLKHALAYNEALLNGRLTTSRGGIVQSIFIGSLEKRLEELLKCSERLKNDFGNYLISGKWPDDIENHSAVLLSWYLTWYSIPASSVIKTTVEKIKPKLISSSLVPLLRLLFPNTHMNAIGEVDKLISSSLFR
ncbi:hypothetical protein LWI28_001215 [Acer negundo]|uniref:Anaphase-promoting complex subunit 1 C-terminal domain-containing protein n=1 Tax=Acer negundo TaxID=4023 RepID=A0AAD5I858_ACENE|nr:hypothetical protein LWI28_001215 [Acer negundo]